MTWVNVEVKRIRIPRFVEKLPNNIVDAFMGRPAYRIQRSIGERFRMWWRRTAPAYFDVRRRLGLPVTHQWEKALTYKVEPRAVKFEVRPCLGRDGFNYALSLMYGRKGIDGKHYVMKFDRLVQGGKVRGTTSRTFDDMMKAARRYFEENIGAWSKVIMDRAIRIAKRGA